MNETTEPTAIFAPIWRRKWLILAVGIVVGVGGYFYYKGKTPVYSATTSLFLGVAAEEAAPGEKSATRLQGVNIAAQAALINSITVEQVRQQLRAAGKRDLARSANIKARNPEKSEFVSIFVEGPSTGAGAALAANLTAQLYIARARTQHQRVIERAIALNRRQLRRLEAETAAATAGKGKKSGAASTSTVSILRATALSQRINELESTLNSSSAQQVKPAKPENSQLVKPQPRKDAIFGFVIGIVLASIAAYMLSRFDRRTRSLSGIERSFHTQVLTAIPKVTRPIVTRDGVATSSRLVVEPMRRLHAAITPPPAGVDRAPGGRVLMFTSADAGDGKSTVVANLALVQRDAGERVVIVEANFRRPVQARLLGLDGTHGLADVVSGKASVESVIQRVSPVYAPEIGDAGEGAEPVVTALESRAGSLFLLAGDATVANPPTFCAQAVSTGLLDTLASEFDCVLVDAPSPLEFSDAMPMLSSVGGLVIVARVGHTREVAAERLVELLRQSSAAPVLGVVANCAGRRDSERYGFSTPNGRVWPRKPLGR